MEEKVIKQPCPFCGNKAENIKIDKLGKEQYRVHCPNCQCTFNYIASKNEIIDLWNKRV